MCTVSTLPSCLPVSASLAGLLLEALSACSSPEFSLLNSHSMNWDSAFPRCAIILVLAMRPLDAHCLFEDKVCIVELLWRPSTGLGIKYFNSAPATQSSPLFFYHLDLPLPLGLCTCCLLAWKALPASYLQCLISLLSGLCSNVTSSMNHFLTTLLKISNLLLLPSSRPPTLFFSKVLSPSGILNSILIYLFIVCLSPLERSFHKDGDFICLFTGTSRTFSGT